MTESLSELERAIYDRWCAKPFIGFLAIGRLHGVSDSAARRHFDAALDKLKHAKETPA